MLEILMCSGRTAFDDDAESPSRSRLKRSFSAGADGRSPRRKIAKGQIGGPFGFKHETHLGFDELNGSESRWDLKRWQQELEVRSNASSRSPQTPSFLLPLEFTQPSQQAPAASSSLARSPTASTATSTGRGGALPRAPVKRKPAPTVEPVVSETSSTPIAALYSQRRGDADNFWFTPVAPTPEQQEQVAQPRKPLVPLLDPPALPSRRKGLSGEPTPTHYVTQTTKIRWDGAMAEIERALKESN